MTEIRLFKTKKLEMNRVVEKNFFMNNVLVKTGFWLSFKKLICIRLRMISQKKQKKI